MLFELENIQKQLIWPSKSKIKSEAKSSYFKDGAFKNVDINKKIASLQSSSIKRLFGNSFHEWKLIPLKRIKKSFGDDLI